MKKIILLHDYITLYSLLTAKPIDYLTTLDCMETLIPNFEEIAALHMLDQISLQVDDTTSKSIDDLIKTTKYLVPLMTQTCEDYDRISNSEVVMYLTELSTILISSAVIMYKTYGFEDLIDMLMKSGSINLANGKFNKNILEYQSDNDISLEEYVEDICSVFKIFRPFLPEYNLSEDELSDVHAAMFEANLPSNAIGTLSPEYIRELLSGGVMA